MRRMWERGWLGQLPWAIYHSPQDQREFPAGILWKHAAESQLSDIVATCLCSIQFWPRQTSGQRRLEFLGKHMLEIGSMPVDDFLEFLRLQTFQRISRMSRHLHESLEKRQRSPGFWARDVERYIELASGACATPDYFMAANPAGQGSGASLERLQDIVRRFGELLSSWGEMVNAARALRAAGTTMVKPIIMN
jgi:hypothetical protein